MRSKNEGYEEYKHKNLGIVRLHYMTGEIRGLRRWFGGYETKFEDLRGRERGERKVQMGQGDKRSGKVYV